VDVDCLCDGTDVYVCGIMEHIEEAGIHSGDSACSLPVHSLGPDIVAELERQTVALAKALNVGGLMNVQYAIKDGEIYVLEVNPRASRTVPFVAKTDRARRSPRSPRASWRAKSSPTSCLRHARRPRAQPHRGQGSGVPVLEVPRRRHAARPGNALDRRGHGPRPRLRRGLRQGAARRRRGTAEIGRRVHLGQGQRQGTRPRRRLFVDSASAAGHRRHQRYLAENGVPATKINKVLEGRPHIEDAIRNRQVQLVINTTEGKKAFADSKPLRRAALANKVPYFTTMAFSAVNVPFVTRNPSLPAHGTARLRTYALFADSVSAKRWRMKGERIR
jgi:carbamoyl-phosphate synthase large subunit